MSIKPFISALVVIVVFTPQLAMAQVAEFNPNYILSDEELQDASTMDREGIQVFLEENGSYLAHLKTEDHLGTERLASDIIYRAAQEHTINPKYLLVKLQKEQSLITAQNPSQRTLDWATGYAVCDACSKDDPRIQKFKGFGKQVDYAAGVMRWYYQNAGINPIVKQAGQSLNISGQTVIPQTNATAFLYTYTPHILGNKNFWTLWQKWFSQLYPDGSLVKAPNDATVYLIQGNEKRAFANYGALATRFDPNLILTIPESELANYTVGPSISLPNYAVLRQGNRYYLLDNTQVREFQNQSVVRNLGYNPGEFIDVTAADIAAYEIGPMITSDSGSPQNDIIELIETGELYLVKDNTISPIMHPSILESNFRGASPRLISVSELGSYTRGEPILFKNGTLFGIQGSNRIYVMEDGKRRHIANEEVFLGLGYKWENIKWIDEPSGLVHPPGQAVYLNRAVAQSPTAVAGTQTTNVVNNIGNINTSTNRVEDGRVWITPEERTEYVSSQKIDTPVNTYLIADAETGEILAGKNIDEVRPLASMTKVVSAYVMMREGLNPNKSVAYSPTRHKATYHQFRIAEGEEILAKDLLDSALVSSLNTPVYMLLTAVGLKSGAFTANMNSLVSELGLTDTRFVSPTGEELSNEGTARDYLSLYRRATNNIDIASALRRQSYEYNELKDLDGSPRHYDVHTNDLLRKQASLPFTIGPSKTGYLYESGTNLAMTITRKADGKSFVVITMGNPEIDAGVRFNEPERIARWAVETF